MSWWWPLFVSRSSRLFGSVGSVRMWAIIGQGEPAAASVGVNVVWVRTAAFTLAGVLSGIAGGLLAGTIGFLAAPTFTASESVLLFALVLAAGTRSLFGPVVAALLYRAVPSLFDEIGIPGDIATIVFGLLLIHAMITGGDGLTGQVRATWTRLRLRFDDPGAAMSATNPRTGHDMIELTNFTVNFGPVRAVDGLTVAFEDRITGLIGPNGAGKTTLLGAVAGQIPASGPSPG